MSRLSLLSDAIRSPLLLDFAVFGVLLLSTGIAYGWRLGRAGRKRASQVASAPDAASSSSSAESGESLLLASLSHEIRTPLNGIAGMSNFLVQSNLDADQHECVRTIQSCVDSLLALVNHVLDYSKLKSGQLEVESIPFDLRSQLEEALDVFAVEAQARGVTLLLDVPEGAMLLVRGDPHRLRQILLNFVSNAVKFTPHSGEVTLSARVEGRGPNEVLARLSVTDTGVGIPAEKLPNLFQAFRQLDASTTREYGGTGLGLAISRGLAHRMGGEVGVESEAGVGSTFWVELTLDTQSPEQAQQESVDFDGACILVVDPSASSRTILVRQLKAWNVSVSTASTLSEAARRMREEPVRVALCSADFPRAELLALAKGTDRAKSGRLALCLIREKGIESEADAGFSAKFSQTLFRPLKQAHILAVLRDALGESIVSGSASEAPSPEPQRAGSLEETHFRRLVRILIVDDNQLNRTVAQKMLLKLGFHSQLAANGKEAIEAVSRSPFDLIFMDRQMPVMDGVEATRIIREREAGGRRTPIVALTADALERARQTCLEAGMDDFITKPVTCDDLAAKIMRWVHCVSA